MVYNPALRSGRGRVRLPAHRDTVAAMCTEDCDSWTQGLPRQLGDTQPPDSLRVQCSVHLLWPPLSSSSKAFPSLFLASTSNIF